MAIEFNCPYCTAAIRVPDAASGKKGSCPACQTLIRVPAINLPAGEPSAPSSATDPSLAATDEFPSPPPPFPVDPDGAAPQASSPFQVQAGGPSKSRYVRDRNRRKTRGLVQLVLPLLILALASGAGVGYLYWSAPSFEGQLNGMMLASDTSFRASYAPPANIAENPAWKTLLEDLQVTPLSRPSNLLEILFGSTAGELTVQLQPGTAAMFVRVPILMHADVARHVKSIAASLESERQQEVDEALAELVQKLASGKEPGTSSLFDLGDASTLNRLTLNLNRGGFGRICEGVISGTSYPCVHEDAEGQLTFFVPKGTREFSIRVRSDLAERRYFPSPLAINVTVTSQASSSAPAAESPTLSAPASDEDSSPVNTEPNEDNLQSRPIRIQ